MIQERELGQVNRTIYFCVHSDRIELALHIYILQILYSNLVLWVVFEWKPIDCLVLSSDGKSIGQPITDIVFQFPLQINYPSKFIVKK
jgi:hypothetical protein